MEFKVEANTSARYIAGITISNGEKYKLNDYDLLIICSSCSIKVGEMKEYFINVNQNLKLGQNFRVEL